MNMREVTIVLRRQSAYYTVTFIIPVILITSIALLGKYVHYSVGEHFFLGLFSPFTNQPAREEKCTLGMTSLLTIAVILLIIAEMVPKSNTAQFPLLGILFVPVLGLSPSSLLLELKKIGEFKLGLMQASS
jgi:nicotinic acetylcholine receptor